MPDFSTRLQKQLDDQWSNILIRRKSAEAILALVAEAETHHNRYVTGCPMCEALRALNEE